MPVFLGESSKVLFVHIPKTGGTSVEKLFRQSGYRMAYRDGKVGRDSFNWVRQCSPQHLHAAMLAQTLRLDRFDVIFALVRDPLARFRSEYAHRQRKDLRTDSASVDAWVDQVLSDFESDPYVWDNHIRPQSEFLVDGSEVYRLEDGLEKMAADLRERFGLALNEEVPHAMNRATATGVSSREVQLSPRTEERLRDFYRADFERFGY